MKKSYRVLKADFPLLVQDILLSTGMLVELEETEQVKSLLEMGVLKEENTKRSKKEASNG
jgi:hypothetical protein